MLTRKADDKEESFGSRYLLFAAFVLTAGVLIYALIVKWPAWHTIIVLLILLLLATYSHWDVIKIGLSGVEMRRGPVKQASKTKRIRKQKEEIASAVKTESGSEEE